MEMVSSAPLGGDYKRGSRILAELAEAYGFYLGRTEDRAQAMRLTCKAAIRFGCHAVAAWTNRSVYTGQRKTPAMAFRTSDATGHIVVLVNGVSLEPILGDFFDLGTGKPGWQMLVDDAVEYFAAWAKEVDVDEPLYPPFASLHASHSREARLMLDLEEQRKINQEQQRAIQVLQEALKAVRGDRDQAE